MLLVRQYVTKPPDVSADCQDRAQNADGVLVTSPAKSNVMPKARTIGHAVGAGSSTVSATVRSLLVWFAGSCSQTPFSFLTNVR